MNVYKFTDHTGTYHFDCKSALLAFVGDRELKNYVIFVAKPKKFVKLKSFFGFKP